MNTPGVVEYVHNCVGDGKSDNDMWETHHLPCMACYNWSRCRQITADSKIIQLLRLLVNSLHCSLFHSTQVPCAQNDDDHQIFFHIEHTQNAMKQDNINDI